jgi:hypothetical protein
MIHVGQQSAFPKLKFIANRAKLERAIQEGRRKYRPRGVRDEEIINTLSEEDLRSLLKRTHSDGGDVPYPASGSESSSSAGLSRPGSPIDLPLGFNFTRKKKEKLGKIATNIEKEPDVPDSPSLSKRLSGWWAAMSPQASPRPDVAQPTSAQANLRASPYSHDRPNSMFELRTPVRLGDFPTARKQSRVFDDSEDDEVAQSNSRHKQQHRGSEFAEANSRADDADYHGEANFGDDEEDRKESQNVGIGLGLEE